MSVHGYIQFNCIAHKLAFVSVRFRVYIHVPKLSNVEPVQCLDGLQSPGTLHLVAAREPEILGRQLEAQCSWNMWTVVRQRT